MSHADKDLYEFATFRLDIAERLLLSKGKRVQISEKAFETLCVLVRGAGSLISKDELLARVWKDAIVEENNLDKCISLLRQALGERKGKVKFIETVRGRGYRFVAEVRRIEKEEAKQVLKIVSPTQNNESVNPNPLLASGDYKIQVSGNNVVALAEWRRDAAETEANEIEPIPAPTEPNRENPSAKIVQSEFGRQIQKWLWLAAALVLFFLALVFAVRNFVLRENPNGNSSGKNSIAAPFEAFKLRRHTDSGNVMSAAISSDGKFIAYTDNSNVVWLKNVATESRVKVFPESESERQTTIGAFSPDGDYIYFVNRPRNKKSELLKISVLGDANPQKIAEDVWTRPTLSPDGKQISFIRKLPDLSEDALIIANTDRSSERKLAAYKRSAKWFRQESQVAAWSPDGKRIACTGGARSDEKPGAAVSVISVANGEETLLPKSDWDWRWIDALNWLPDGDTLLTIAEEYSSPAQIYKLTISTGKWQKVTNDLNNYIGLSVTPNGRSVITTEREEFCNLWILSGNDSALSRRITSGRNRLDGRNGIAWTPDGKIIYSSNVNGKWEIWTVDADGENQKQLTQGCAGNDSCSSPVVTPDGRYIFFHAERKHQRHIWRMNIDGTQPVQMTKGSNDILPFITPDGRFVIYTADVKPKATLWQIPVEGGVPQQINDKISATAAAVSPDGKRMAFGYYNRESNSPMQLGIMQFGADSPEKLFDVKGFRLKPVWSADGKALYYLAGDYSAIRKQYLDDKRELFLEFPGESINNFAFSPDGKYLVVSRSKPTQDIVVLTDMNSDSNSASNAIINSSFTSLPKSYLQMSEAEQIVFISERARQIQALIGDEPTQFDEKSALAIKAEIDRSVQKKNSLSQKPFEEGLRTIYGRASQYAPLVSRAFEARRVAPALGIYQAMIESEYHDCLVSPTGSVGLFQFSPRTASSYGLTARDYCDVEKQSNAAAALISDLSSDFGDGKSSASLGLLGFTVGAETVRDYLRQLRGRGLTERNFWAIFRHRQDLQPTLTEADARYVPRFFSAAIIGENPQTFELSTPPLSTLR